MLLRRSALEPLNDVTCDETKPVMPSSAALTLLCNLGLVILKTSGAECDPVSSLSLINLMVAAESNSRPSIAS